MARRIPTATFALLVLLSLFAAPSALADPGDLDPNWSADGKVKTSYGDASDGANAVAVQADQKVIAVGATDAFFGGKSLSSPRGSGLRASGGGNCDWAIVRYREDGVLDGTYGTLGNGKVRLGEPAQCDVASDVALDANGNAVVVGWFGDETAVARLLPTGTLDATFNPGGATPGIAIFDLGSEFSQATGVAIDPSGRILITGFAGFDIVGFVARLEPDGDLDPTFATAGDDGIYFFDEAFPTAETRALDLVRQSNGAIVAVGSIVQGLASQGDGFGIEAWLVLRLTDGGALDGTFNPGGSPPGTRLLFQGSAFAEARAVALQGNKLIVVGIFIEEACCDGPGANGLITAQFFAPVVRLNANGSRDTAFANGGVKFIDAGPDGEGLNDVMVQPIDRKIVIVGTESEFVTSVPEEVDMLAVRLSKDGAYDSTFHADGRVTVDFGAFEEANGGALKLDGNIFLAGFSSSGCCLAGGTDGGNQSDIAVARLFGDPKGIDCTISGTPGNDILTGTAGPDVLCGFAGNDTLKGFKGNDILRGGLGNDTLEGGPGFDYILGYAGNDTLNAADGVAGDVVEGSSGADTCSTDPGDVIIDC